MLRGSVQRHLAAELIRRASSRAAPVALLVAAAGCASTPAEAPSVSMPGSPIQLVRHVEAFEVRDLTGAVLAHPWFGGFNVPRPQLVDIDGDGDLDLFVQESTGSIRFFERTGGTVDPVFHWRTDKYLGLDTGEWYRFADMDADGDWDLLTETQFSFIRLFRNDGTSARPDLVLATDSIRDSRGEAIFADRQNIPNVTDIDCNGRLDLFIGQLTGTVKRYEATARPVDGLPRFRLVSDRFENIEIVNQIGSLHGANTLAMYDYDSDGDEDIFWGDFFEPGLLLVRNNGPRCSSPDFGDDPVSFPPADPIRTSGFNAPAFGDMDGDGDQDLLVGVLGGAFNPNRTTIDNLYFLEQTGPGEFSERSRQFLTGIDVGSESLPAFTDLDGDGDLDLLIGNKIEQDALETGRLFRFDNVGTARNPVFQMNAPLPFEGAYHYAPAFGDVDADGRPEMFLGTWKSGISVWTHSPGAAEWRAADDIVIRLGRGTNLVPALVDIDADGDLDLFAGESSGELNFWRNTGTGAEPAFELVSEKYGEIDAGRRSAPTFADLDGDGDQDLVIGRESDGLMYLRNDGSQTEPIFVPDPSFAPLVPAYSTPVFVDIDSDGDLDLFSGGIGGGIVFFENPDA